MCKYAICGGKIILPDKILHDKCLIIENGKIAKIISENETIGSDYEIIDADGLYASPGFVDIHQHGGGGYDYMDEEEETYYEILSTHLKHGTTSVMPTLLSASFDNTVRAIKQYLKAKEDKRIQCNLLGIHIEGPYISHNQAGAQKPENIRDFCSEEYENLYEISQGEIKRWSVAPEINGAEEFSQFANEKGIVLSVAHSDADFDTVLKAYGTGWHHATHLYSSMSSVVRKNGFRVAGVLEAAFYLDGMDVEIIADGCHLPLSLLKLITKIKGTDRVSLITDAMRAAGQDVTTSYLGSKDDPLPAIIEDGVAKMVTRDGFAGSVATSDRLLRTMLEAGVSLVDGVKMLTINPLSSMNLKCKKGLIKEGYDADICFFDETINVKKVMVNGTLFNVL